MAPAASWTATDFDTHKRNKIPAEIDWDKAGAPDASLPAPARTKFRQAVGQNVSKYLNEYNTGVGRLVVRNYFLPPLSSGLTGSAGLRALCEDEKALRHRRQSGKLRDMRG